MIFKKSQRYLLASVCGYEAVALFYDGIPTISHICWRFKFPIPIILIGLGIHLLSPPPHLKKIKSSEL